MSCDDAQDAKLQKAKRRAGWTMPLEHYYPAETPAEPMQGITETVQVSSSAQHPYTVEPIAGGCAVIYPHFGGVGIRFRNRADGTRGEH